MKNIFKLILVSLICATTSFGGYSSGSRSSSSSSGSRSSSSSSGSKSWGSSSKPSTPSRVTPSTPSKSTSSSGSFWGSSKSSTPATPSSSASSALKQKQVATPVKSKTDYVSEFKAKNESKYVNKFASEPTKRPDYIPSSYSSGGNNYNIVYNSGYGGYGFFNTLGAWVVFDAVTHAAHTNYQREYAYSDKVVVNQSGWSTFWLVVGSIVIVAIIAIAFIAIL